MASNDPQRDRNGAWATAADLQRWGQLPAGPMADRRTHRLRDRGSVRRAAIADQR